MSDNRTNEQIVAEALAGEGRAFWEYPNNDRDRDRYLDEAESIVGTLRSAGRLAGEPKPSKAKSSQDFVFTEAQIQRATIEYREHFFRSSNGTTRICVCGVATEGLAELSEHRMRAALVAAQGAAPQAECDCGAGPGSAVCKKVCATRAPVQPSSTSEHYRGRDGICEKCGQGLTGQMMLGGEPPCKGAQQTSSTVDGYQIYEAVGEVILVRTGQTDTYMTQAITSAVVEAIGGESR